MKESIQTSNKQPENQGEVNLEEVAKQFAHFRQTHQKGARIPQELREAVEKLAEEGISLSEVLPTCGLTLWQYQRWHKSKSQSNKIKNQKSESRKSAVRVFPVVNKDSSYSDRNQELELRLGPWSVSIKLAESANRGSACFP
jgi:hypothetical protein